MTYATNLNSYLNPTPETILRKGNYGYIHYEEWPCSASGTPPYPGMLCLLNSDNTVSVQTSVGGDVPVMVAVENALAGLTVNDQYTANNVVRLLIAEPGHVVQAPIPIGVQTSVGTQMISAGDGSWTPVTGLRTDVLYVTVANSNMVSNVAVATSFGQTYTIPAASLVAGDVLHIVAQGTVPNTTTNTTLNVALKFGSTVIGSTTAIDPANGDMWLIEADIVVRTAGASGTIVATGVEGLGTQATVTAKPFYLGSTSANTNANIVVDVTAAFNAAATTDNTQMNILTIERLRSIGQKPLGMALTALNNVSGSGYEFVDVMVY